MRGKTAEDRQLLELLDPVAEAAGYEIVRLRLMGGDEQRRLQIMGERPLLEDGTGGDMNVEDCARLSRAMAETAGRLKMMGIVPWIDQPAGMFLWCRLPDGIEAEKVARHALADNVVLAPGNAFSLSHTAGRFMRFNVAQCADERIFRALAKAMEK